MKQYGEKVFRAFLLARKRALGYATFTGGITFIGNIAVAAVLWYGGFLVIQGELSPGTLTSFVIYSLCNANNVF